MNFPQTKNIIRDLALVYYLTKIKIHKEIVSKFFGFVWWLLDPLINMSVLYIVTALILELRTDDKVVFLLSGLLLFRYMQSSISNSTRSLSPAMSLSSLIYLPKYVFVIRDIFSEFFKLIIGLFVLIILVNIVTSASIQYFEVLFVALTCLIFCLSLSSIFANLGIIFPDISNILGYTFRALFFLSGIFFDLSRVPAEWQGVFLSNPFALLIHNMRLALILPGSIDYASLLILIAISVTLSAFGFYFLVKLDRIYPKIVL